MSTEIMEIEKGMEVYTTHGEKIGSISHVWTGVGRGTSPGYFKLGEGGFLGFGETELYIPFSAVETVVPGQCLTLNCGKEDCTRLFAAKPDFLDHDE